MSEFKKVYSHSFSLIVSGWFALCVFSTSEKFSEAENDIKSYIAIIGGLLILVSTVIFTKNIQQFIQKQLDPLTMRMLFIVGVFAAIHGFLQYLGIMPSHHAFLNVTGTYENPAGISAVRAMLLPIGLQWYLLCSNRTKLVIGLFVLFILMTIFLSRSRTAILAAFVSVATMLAMHTSFWQKFRSHRIFFLHVIVGFLISLSIGLYLWKPESLVGRLFIWRIALSMVPKHFICGYGVDGFRSRYMLQQADFFNYNPHTQYELLADNIYHPFNEFINILINWGIIGLLLFVGIMVSVAVLAHKQRMWYSSIVISFILSLFVLCFFSYPLKYAAVWIIFIIVSILPLQHYFSPKINFIQRFVVLVFTICSFRIIHKDIIADINWKKISDQSLFGYSEQMIPYFQYLYINTYLRDNPYFLYNYAAELNYIGKYKESIDVIKKCQTRMNDYNIVLLLADNYVGLNMPDSTIQYAKLASRMIPCRFLPFSYMIDAYKEKNDDKRVKKVAKDILNKPIKVNSTIVDDIRKDAWNSLNTQNIRTTQFTH